MTIFSTNPSNGKYSVSRSGMIVTNNEEIADRARLLRTHAITTTYDDFGNYYIVEMQVAKDKTFIKRAQYYAAKAYSSQLNVGENYNNLKEIIFLAIIDFELFPDKKDFKSDHVILDKKYLLKKNREMI